MAEEVQLKLEHFEGSKPGTTNDSDSGNLIEVHGPGSIRLAPETPIGSGDWVLEAEYFSVGGVEQATVTPGPAYEESESCSLPAFSHSETFSHYAARLVSTGPSRISGSNDLRLDLKMKSDAVFQFRNAKLRRMHAGEFEDGEANDDARAQASPWSADSTALNEYFSQSHQSRVASVSVNEKEIVITGSVAGKPGNIFVGDISIETLITEEVPYNSLSRIEVDENGAFSITLPRYADLKGHSQDRLTSRWQLYRRENDRHVAISHARYAEDVHCYSPDLPPAQLKSKKGLGGWSACSDPDLKDELRDLGIAAVTVNINQLHTLASPRPHDGFTPFSWQGRPYYANEARLAQLDKTFREAEEIGAMVSVILLLSNPADTTNPDVRLLGHPDAARAGKFAMPNVTSAEGASYYGAILNLMAQRWSQSDGEHGRVHQWIVHNEIDYGWVWTNAGVKTDIAFMDLYQRSMRLVDLITRQYDPHARAWISLTHHWGQPGDKHGYGSKRMLDLLVQYCDVEGNFPWALAYHPYPQNLFNPRTWEDDQGTFSFDTPKITPRNLEVLDAYMKLPKMRYGEQVRPVHLSENGFNSRDYSPQSMVDQAAGMALAWNKIQKLSSIESWQYHNWIDNRHEGGLRIGLRKFRDDEEDRLGKKPIWHLYQSLGTETEESVAMPYLETIGVESWEELIYTGKIE